MLLRRHCVQLRFGKQFNRSARGRHGCCSSVMLTGSNKHKCDDGPSASFAAVNRLAISSMSLGSAKSHSPETKLRQAADHDFQGVEVFFPDVKSLAQELPGGANSANEVKAAGMVRQICDECDLEIISLQPFIFYNGVLDKHEHSNQLEKLQLWFKLAKALRTNLISVPSNTMMQGVT